MLKKIFSFCILFSCIFAGQSIQAQNYTLTGNTFEERCESMINCMVNDIEPYTGNVNIKYTAPFYWARIYKGVDSERAISQLETLYDAVIANPSSVTGSDIEFFAHMTIHGYFLCKDQIPATLKLRVKTFLKQINFNTNGSTATLNLDMMRYTAGLLAAQEWSDFTDLKGKNATQITAYNRSRIINTLNNIYHNNCKEMDAFVYLPTNTMYIRMLAEFSTDEEIQQKAYVVYQQIIAAMVGAWNQGLYIANPPRSKGWAQLVAGQLGTNSRITALAWLFFGNPTNTIQMLNQYVSDSDNYAVFCFWSAYKRNIKPLQAILDAEKRKTFPYEYISYIDDKTVNASNNIVQNWKNYKYTYQSKNYGLATQTEIPYNLSAALSRYTYKETKRTYLAWQSDETSQCFFTVCQDNPERPTDAVNANAAGYGENPFHRVLQYKGAAIGVTNVPTTYLEGKRYQLYVPFSRVGIKLKVESDNWVFCHTGSMMFAFRTIEPFSMMTRSPYNVANCDVLMFTDQTTRKGSWILQTTEITDDLKGATLEEEINKFKTKLLANSSFDTVNYDTDTPQLRYTSMDGDVLDLTFFAPTLAYSDQYKINGKVQTLGDGSLYNSPYTKQTDKSDDVYIYNTDGEPTILNWKDPVPSSSIAENISDNKGVISCYTSGGMLYVNNIPADGLAEINIYDGTGSLVKKKRIEITNNQASMDVGNLTKSFFLVHVKSDRNSWIAKHLITVNR
ncbi:T9SS C-terminal target domain-containing protein [Dysgonomonas sp. 520]|uniref:T9SS C-terminal target domain-containing protein n=1 Tax=Dysgonomonas sp. 520 TaxID=2302931 RepID=UPI0013D05482|nr:T9SS C-terminal target domain-containing protein [Dysgonomonas sp. 520]NDW08215.1 T9SS C-terminal target domain-containing protein [Dysgonomonas sp. 520]